MSDHRCPGDDCNICEGRRPESSPSFHPFRDHTPEQIQEYLDMLDRTYTGDRTCHWCDSPAGRAVMWRGGWVDACWNDAYELEWGRAQ